MPLIFNERKLLSPGVHDATLGEIQEQFARFQRTDRRMMLFQKLLEYVRSVQQTGWSCEIIIDGSFVMPAVDEPNDIDVILVMPKEWDLTAELRPFEYNVVSKRYTKANYHIDVYPVLPGSMAESKFLELFEQVRLEWCHRFDWPADCKKGIVRIIP